MFSKLVTKWNSVCDSVNRYATVGRQTEAANIAQKLAKNAVPKTPEEAFVVGIGASIPMFCKAALASPLDGGLSFFLVMGGYGLAGAGVTASAMSVVKTWLDTTSQQSAFDQAAVEWIEETGEDISVKELSKRMKALFIEVENNINKKDEAASDAV